MYISPFVMGILAMLIAEFVAMILYAIYKVYSKGGK